MSLLAPHPLFLSLLPLALAPILFHLFFRIRRRAVAFSTFMFFQRIHPRLSERRKVRDWLILLLRVLAIALLLLALAGLVWTSGGRGGRTAAVLILDNSASMSRRAASGELLLDAARAAANAALGTLEAGDSAALITTVRDPAAPDAGTLSRDRDRVTAALRAVPPTEAAGRPADALRRALDQLGGVSGSRREIHVFTDLQENEWGAASGPAAAPAGLTVRFHRLPAAAPPVNVSLLGIDRPGMRLLASRRIPLTAKLKAWDQPAAVLLNWVDPAGRPGALDVRLAAGEEKAVPFSLGPQSPGSSAMAVWISGDDFPPDNKTMTALDIRPRQAVLFIGLRSSFGFLPAALAPGGNADLSGLEPVFAEPDGAAAALREKAPLLAVVAWDRLPAGTLAETLRGYVSGGGRLLVLPETGSAGSQTPVPDWLGARPGALEKPGEPLRLIPLDKGASLFDGLREADGRIRLRQVRVSQFLPLEAGPGSVPLLGLEDGRPLLTQQAAGSGRIYTCGLALNGAWSTLPLKPGFLSLVQQLALEGAAGPAVMPALQAGDPFPAPPAGLVKLRLEAAPAVEWQGDSARLPVPSRSGVWSVGTETGAVRYAVSASAGEGRFAVLSGSPVPAVLGLPHTVETASSSTAVAERIRRDRQGSRLFTPLLIACLLALLGESLLANPRLGGP
jgi:hypothetical protein